MRYYEELDKASEPQKLQAKAAYEGCLQVSVTHQHFDENARACEVWLSKNYGNDYHLVDEFRGSPSRVKAGMGDKMLPVDLGGQLTSNDAPVAAPDKTVSREKAASPDESASPQKGAAPGK